MSELMYDPDSAQLVQPTTALCAGVKTARFALFELAGATDNRDPEPSHDANNHRSCCACAECQCGADCKCSAAAGAGCDPCGEFMWSKAAAGGSCARNMTLGDQDLLTGRATRTAKFSVLEPVLAPHNFVGTDADGLAASDGALRAEQVADTAAPVVEDAVSSRTARVVPAAEADAAEAAAGPVAAATRSVAEPRLTLDLSAAEASSQLPDASSAQPHAANGESTSISKKKKKKKKKSRGKHRSSGTGSMPQSPRQQLERALTARLVRWRNSAAAASDGSKQRDEEGEQDVDEAGLALPLSALPGVDDALFNTACDDLAFPMELSPADRQLVHAAALRAGLLHASCGAGADR
ncbi:hypothetical protein JKP88DRAFT_230748 [Tribonema minus]|uniref:R3H domain-containing protein n=1 Tax=Tribonema minus TaxID=303371 RepID=A0A835ZF76_9STRA|nr:hypothetical protein JKP88DRAFT_230748 [Tribonema minus]